MKLLKIIKNNIVYILIVVFIFAVSRCFSIGLATGESMSPTIPSPSILLINKLDKDLQRNDIVVCREGGLKTITKRIIGVPGESVTITVDGKVFINNTLYEDEYGNISFPMYLSGDRSYPVVLGEDEYFVMGDNRNVSADSRNTEIGNIKKENIVGKVMNF
jgi:signal peptidase I